MFHEPLTYFNSQSLIIFDVHGVHASQMYFQVQPTRCIVTQFIYFCEMLYMFQAISPHIIRSSNLYIQHLVKTLLQPATSVAGSSKGLTR